MSAKVITATAINAAKPRSTRYEIPDGGCVGLRVCVQPSGHKSFVHRFRFNGKTVKTTHDLSIGLAAARRRVMEERYQLEQGINPAAGQQRDRAVTVARDDDSVEALAQQFIELHARRKTRATTAAQTEDILNRIVLPEWRRRRVQDIRRRDVIALAEHIAVDRPYMANRTLGVLSKWFAWMVARDVLETSPAAGVERPHKEEARSRILGDHELRALWLACDGDNVFGAFFKVLVLTGQRRGEVAGMRWNEIDEERRLWSLPANRAKNGHAHRIPLSTQAWALLENLPRIGEYVFSYDGGARPIAGFSKPKRALAARAKVSGFRLHDVRRSTASGLQRLGVAVPVVEAALNHVSGTFRGVTGTYLRHDYADEIRIALQKWADHVERLIGGKPAKIIALRGKGQS
jgi:integrase